jgi:hypothetical protein
VERLAKRLGMAAARVAPGSVIPGTLSELARIQRLLHRNLQGPELLANAEELRDVLFACGTHTVQPQPIAELIRIDEELLELAHREPREPPTRELPREQEQWVVCEMGRWRGLVRD